VFVRFRVDGSETGFDGEGTSSTRFVSNSGRVVIPPESWYPFITTTRVPVPPGSTFSWPVVTSFQSEIFHSATLNTNRTTTVALGLANGTHRIRVTGGPTGFRGFRVFNPAAMTHPAITKTYNIQSVSRSDSNLQFNLNVTGRYIIESSSSLIAPNWHPVTSPLTQALFRSPISATMEFYRIRGLD